jgi:CubicO group peptidase (beta-lactamase class C family)
MDSQESEMSKMESGLNLTAVDFAKLGRLVLHKGKWNGKQVVPEQWINACMEINPGHNLKAFGEEIYYENFWWLYSRDRKTAYIVSGWGHLGQYLYLFPETNMIIVRMGKKTGKVDSWGNIFKEIAGYR